MAVQIDFDSPGTEINDDGKSGYLILHDPEKDESYASWPFYARDYEGPRISTHWTWENPDDALSEITLSPSLMLQWDEPNTFHVFIRGGEVEHCSDCQCGCDT